jgi:cytochrome b6-f complex iron-sulfur subunit
MSKPKMQKDNRPVEPEAIDRRVFLATAFGGVSLCYAAALGYPVYRYLASPVEKSMAAAAITEVTLKDAQKLPAGSAMLFKFGTKPALLIHHQDKWVAFDAVCTHMGCTVQYQPPKDREPSGRIYCGCHGGVYDASTGANVSGPPPRPLKPYKVEVTDAGVLITRT